MGESLIYLTYHEEGMGSPDELAADGISWRVMDWYDFAMGGAAGNGADIGNINTVGVENLTANPIPIHLDAISGNCQIQPGSAHLMRG